MTLKSSRLFGGLTMKLVILSLMILGLGLAGCSDDNANTLPAGGNESATGVFRVDMDEDVDFEIVSTKNGDPENPIDGPFAIRGKNIRYDGDLGALIVDMTVTNLGDNTFDEVVTLTFLSLLPEGVTVLNPDNSENGPGAAIDFEFENDDAMWTPGEESLPRETHFMVAEGVSIGFVGRLDTGTGGTSLGSIGGIVWDDANGDGIMDEDEAFIEGAMVELSAEGMEPMSTLTGADGTYTFDDLASGFYTVAKMASEGMVATTPARIYVILVLEDGNVVSFLAANFGCMEEEASEGSGVISGKVWNDLNGDGMMDDGELGVAGIPVELSGDVADTTMTGEDGSYEFTELMAGTYSVVSVGPEGWVLTTASPINVMLGEDDTVFDLGIFGWTEEGSGGSGVISGIVWNDLNGDGTPDEGETGVEGIVVNLTGDTTATATTAADGTYAFNELTAGEYVITSVGPEGWVLTTASPINVMLGTDDAVFDLGIFGWMEETSGGTGYIKGKVWNDLNGDGVVNEGEPGLVGQVVTLSGDATATAITLAEGVYTFDDLSAGSYEVVSEGPDGYVLTTDSPIMVTLDTDDAIFNDGSFGWMEEVGGDMAAIGGIVFNDVNGNKVQDDGEPGLEGVSVNLDGTAVDMTTSAADGSYSFIELGIGEYKVRTNGPDGWISTTGDELTIKIDTVDQVVDNAHFGWREEIIGSLASISGIIFNDLNGNQIQDDGEPGLALIPVALDGTSEEATISGEDGSYSFSLLTVGDYTVSTIGPIGWVSTTGDELAVEIDTPDQEIDNVDFGFMEEALTN